MSARLHHEFQPSGFFVLRTPLLPIDEFAAWGAPAAAREADARRTLRDDLIRLFSRPEMLEALWLASPSLFRSLEALRTEPESERSVKAALALVRYFTRATSRSTPFGLFAGCSTGVIGSTSRLELPARRGYARHSRLDTEYLCGLAEALTLEPHIRHEVRCFPNSSLYAVGDRLRYVEWKADRDGRSYELVSVESAEYLLATLERARGGATPRELADALTRVDPDIPADEAAEYVTDLIASQILVSELEPRLTGPEPARVISTRLESCPGAAAAGRMLNTVCAELERLDAHGVGIAPSRYEAIISELRALPAKVEPSRLFQVDLHKPSPELALGETIVEEIARGVEILRRFTWREQERLTRFREAFETRYEQQFVPLVEALDEESGIGFDLSDAPGTDVSPLLAGLDFPADASAARVTWNRRDSHLLRRLCETLAVGGMEMQLTEKDIEALGSSASPLPDAFAVMARLAAPSPEALDQGQFEVLLDLASGPSGVLLLGRFCHGDQRLEALVREHVRAEESFRPDAIFAEIVHLPEGRLGNVILRPVLRAYEITYQGASGAPVERQIPITDLEISVRDERIVLFCRRLGREIIPRLTCAHNFQRRSPGIYRFLCTLQAQGVASGLAWSWGALENAPFLPRVASGRLVLCRARWLLAKREIGQLRTERRKGDLLHFSAWRAERRLPRYFVLVEDDNELAVDADNPLSVDTFLNELHDRDTALLCEMFSTPELAPARGPEGRFAAELVVPFTRKPASAGAGTGNSAASKRVGKWPAPPVQRAAGAARRQFSPGTEWLYLKLYTGVATADRVLTNAIRPLMDEVCSSGAADGWFFVRYKDSDWHVRWRIHGEPDALRRDVLPRVLAAAAEMQRANLVHRVQLDTYVREIERYGGDEGILLSERLFDIDSRAVLSLLESLEGDQGAAARWQLALRGTDLLLNDLGLGLAQKRAVMREMSGSFAREFRVEPAFRRQLAERFRRERALIEPLVRPAWSEDEPLSPGFAILAQRSESLRPVMADLRSAVTSGAIMSPLEDMAASYVHMFLNRLLRSAHRAQELVIYFFLERVYDSLAARACGEES